MALDLISYARGRKPRPQSELATILAELTLPLAAADQDELAAALAAAGWGEES